MFTFKQLATIAGIDVIDLTGEEDPSVGDMVATGTLLGDEIIAELKEEGLIA